MWTVDGSRRVLTSTGFSRVDKSVPIFQLVVDLSTEVVTLWTIVQSCHEEEIVYGEERVPPLSRPASLAIFKGNYMEESSAETDNNFTRQLDALGEDIIGEIVHTLFQCATIGNRWESVRQWIGTLSEVYNPS